jgi:uncharacterized protein
LAKELNADLLIIDELKGRKQAKNLNINILGVLGFLVLAKQKGLVESVKEILDQLLKTSCMHIPNDLYQVILTQAKENI